MAVGRLCCTTLLLLCLCLRDAEAQNLERTVHKKVGDTVELSTGLPSDEVDVSEWRYKNSLITTGETVLQNQFNDRLHLNKTTFTLTVRGVKLQDSGTFKYTSSKGDKQRQTVIITLQVHEPLTKPPVLTSNCTCPSGNSSCSVFIECSATTDSKVDYNWNVGNETIGGPRLRYTIGSQDRDTVTFTCRTSNNVSETSASKTVKCNMDHITQEKGRSTIIYVAVGAGGGILLVLVVTVAFVSCRRRAQRTDSDTNDLTVYADITDVPEDATPPNAVYETIHYETAVPQPMTVYDQIQSSRIKKPSASPYQDVP